MVHGVIPPILAAGGPAASSPSVTALVRAPLPLPTLTPARTATTVYGLSTVDDRGRIADRVVMRVLGWSAGLHLDIREAGGVLTALTDPQGRFRVTGQGYLRVPASLRHRCGLAPGDRVLLAAEPEGSQLTLYPPAALDTLLSQHSDRAGGAA